MDSVLDTIKKMLGITKDYEYFDQDIIVCINTALAYLNQIGFITNQSMITDSSTTWNDIFGDKMNVQEIKSYIGLKTRLLFDPPTNGTIKEAIDNNLSELEWRINIDSE
jgi:hypothetical protein